MNVDLKFVELTADVLEIIFIKCYQTFKKYILFVENF